MELKKSWRPPKRPDWVEIFNAHGRDLDVHSVVPLDADGLIATAMRNTGLADFGTDDWRQPFNLLVQALEEEADLNLLGRIMTRGELLNTLQARLRIEDTYKHHPEIEDGAIGAPLIITGAARTGTTALYNLLASDPENQAPLLWETWFPHPSPEDATYETDARIQKADRIALIWDAITPELPLLHEQRGYLPVEDNYLLAFSMRGPNAWMGKTPSYIQWLGTADLRPSLDYMKRVLKYLQWKHKRKRWVLKTPALTMPIASLFEAFPDAMMVYTHRDPAKLTASSSHLLNTVFWLRSDNHAAHTDFYKIITNDQTIAAAVNDNIEKMESGVIPKKRIFNLLYKDFIQDNVGAVRRIYGYFGIQSAEASFTAMARYADENARARASRAAYKYDDPSPEEVAVIRQIYGRYQSYFGIPNEI